MALGTVAMIVGAIGKKKNQKKLDSELANAPKYKITDEAYENQAIAKSQAFGRDRSIEMQQENIDQSASDAGLQARDVTSSTSALLSTIADINANKNQALRGLGQDEAALQNQKRGQLMGANQAMIDEKDKAWNYNKNMPFQMRVASYRDRIKANEEAQLAGLSYEAQTVSAFASMMGSMGAASDERVKNNVMECHSGLEDVMQMKPVEFIYNKDSRYNDGGKNHIGFIAQEVKEILPQAVKEINPGVEPSLMVDYTAIVPVLVNAIKEQQQQIKDLQDQVKAFLHPLPVITVLER